MFETRLWTTLVFVCALAVAAGCNHEKSRNPLSPSIAGPIEGVTIVPPGPMTTGDSLIPVADQPVTLVFSNATTNGERTVYYGVEIATDSGFTQIVHSASKIPADPLGQTSYQVPVTLDPEQTYYWRTRADDGANASEFSGPGTFEIYTPLSIKAPALVSPVSGTVLAGRKPTLVVDDTVISGPATDVRFRFELATDAGFANIVVVLDVAAEIAQVQAMNGRTSVGHDAALGPRGTVPGVGVNPANVSTGDLAWNTTHYWRARASAVGREGQVIGPWSATGSFVTGLEPVNIDAPTHVSPINGATAAANPPTFVVNNPAVSGQSGPITIHYHVATDSDFANVVSVFSAPMGSGPTTTAVSGSLADDTLFYWHMFATDGTTTGPWSTAQSFRTPAPPPPPPGGGGGGGCGGGGGGGGGGASDELDLSKVTWLHHNVSGWPKTSTVTSTSIGNPPICINHTKSGAWPGVYSGGAGTTVEGNPWVFANVGGKWYGATYEWLRPGQTCKGISASNIGAHIKKSPLTNWVPQSGETIGLMVSTPARFGPEGPVNERSNVVLTTWP